MSSEALNSMPSGTKPIRIMHILHRFATGGLENGVVNIVNELTAPAYQHCIVSVTEADENYKQRVNNKAVTFLDLRKKEGKDFSVFWRAYKAMRVFKPDVLHTRNLSALEFLLPGFIARVPLRVHSEHGRDQSDADGNNLKNQRLRRYLYPFAHRLVALSQETQRYVLNKVGVDAHKVELICNGVNCQRFFPQQTNPNIDDRPEGLSFVYVGRFQAVKNPMLVIEAMAQLLREFPTRALHLLMVGDGPLRAACERWVNEQGLQSKIRFVGNASDVRQWLAQAQVLVIGSNAEGISNTILEAMASGLAVVATDVGGNAELVVENGNGFLVPAQNIGAFCGAMRTYVQDQALLTRHQQMSRSRAEKKFSLDGMLQRYRQLYQNQPLS